MLRLLCLAALSACATSGGVDCASLGPGVPAPRGEVDGIWDAANERLVLVGGNTAVPVNCAFGATDIVGDAWAYHPRCDAFEQLDPQGNASRARARAAVAHDGAGQRMILHGGRFRAAESGSYTVFDDTWVLDLTTDTWTKVGTGGPGPRFDHAGAIVGDAFVVFGGNTSTDGAVLAVQDDVWRLDLDTLQWRQVRIQGQGPSPRTYASAAGDDTRLYVYGGGQADALVGSFLGDLWSLDLTARTWTQLHDGTTDGRAPVSRIWADLVHDGTDLLLWAGHDDGALGNTNDVWRFRLDRNRWQRLRQGDVWANPPLGVCDFPPDFTDVDEGSPERREAGVGVWTGEALMVFGGKTDCGNVDDVWSFDPAAEAWTELSPATTGEVCLRFADDCTSMCF